MRPLFERCSRDRVGGLWVVGGPLWVVVRVSAPCSLCLLYCLRGRCGGAECGSTTQAGTVWVSACEGGDGVDAWGTAPLLLCYAMN
jgi:hypothetical protein